MCSFKVSVECLLHDICQDVLRSLFIFWMPVDAESFGHAPEVFEASSHNELLDIYYRSVGLLFLS